MHTNINLVGSRKYGVFDNDSNYDYIIICTNKEAQVITKAWEYADIKRTNHGYGMIHIEIRGITNSETRIGTDPIGSQYSILMVVKDLTMSDREVIYTDRYLYWAIRINTIPSEIKETVQNRLRVIREYTKSKGLYGGKYPGGVGYLVYTINTVKAGYTDEISLSMLDQPYLYYHNDCGYQFVKHVDFKSLTWQSNSSNP